MHESVQSPPYQDSPRGQAQVIEAIYGPPPPMSWARARTASVLDVPCLYLHDLRMRIRLQYVFEFSVSTYPERREGHLEVCTDPLEEAVLPAPPLTPGLPEITLATIPVPLAARKEPLRTADGSPGDPVDKRRLFSGKSSTGRPGLARPTTDLQKIGGPPVDMVGAYRLFSGEKQEWLALSDLPSSPVHRQLRLEDYSLAKMYELACQQAGEELRSSLSQSLEGASANLKQELNDITGYYETLKAEELNGLRQLIRKAAVCEMQLRLTKDDGSFSSEMTDRLRRLKDEMNQEAKRCEEALARLEDQQARQIREARARHNLICDLVLRRVHILWLPVLNVKLNPPTPPARRRESLHIQFDLLRQLVLNPPCPHCDAIGYQAAYTDGKLCCNSCAEKSQIGEIGEG